jgi:hypothetical protein
MLLPHRKLLQSKAIAIENDLRATLRNFQIEGKSRSKRAGSRAPGEQCYCSFRPERRSG